jgi:serine/threonine protein kinase
MNRDVFCELLLESRLLSTEQTDTITLRFDAEARGHEIGDNLVSEGLLTPFQLQRLLSGETRGLVLGQYRLLDELGRGGFGHVYKALHTVMDRIVALKVIAPFMVEEARARSCFKREVLATTQLFHPNIVMAFDANEADDLLFLVMEYIDGIDLDMLVRKQGPLPIALASEMMRQASQALQYAHERGMVHRDIKPANLLVPRASGVVAFDRPPAVPAPGAAPVLVKVVDFGLARFHRPVNSRVSVTHGDHFLGTPEYVSPEQARDATAVDVRSDLYSLGCTFYYALTGNKPFHGETVFEIIVKHVEKEPIPVEANRPEIPPALSAVIRRLMAKDPARRFQTPAELTAELDFLCNPEQGDPNPLAPPHRSGGRTAPRSRAVPRPPAPPNDDAGLTRCIPQLAYASESDTPTRSQERIPAELLSATMMGIVQVSNKATDEQASVAQVPHAVVTGSPGDAWTESPTTIAESRPVRVDATLQKCWRQWLDIVEAFAQGDETPLGGDRAYRDLHTGLLDLSRTQATAMGGNQQESLRQLTALVEPWVNLQALAAADRETLISLIVRCHVVERKLFGRRRDWSAWLWAAVLLMGFLTAVGGWFASRVGGDDLLPRMSITSLRHTIETHPVVAVIVVLPFVILLSITALVRLLRT